jgi:hypothetical protein
MPLLRTTRPALLAWPAGSWAQDTLRGVPHVPCRAGHKEGVRGLDEDGRLQCHLGQDKLHLLAVALLQLGRRLHDIDVSVLQQMLSLCLCISASVCVKAAATARQRQRTGAAGAGPACAARSIWRSSSMRARSSSSLASLSLRAVASCIDPVGVSATHACRYLVPHGRTARASTSGSRSM